MLAPTAVLVAIIARLGAASQPTLGVDVPHVLTAGVATRINFTTDASDDWLATHPQVFVSVWNTAAYEGCNLSATATFDLSQLSVEITIPPETGPPGSYYMLSLYPTWSTTPGWPYSYPASSSSFFLANATAEFVSYELPDPGLPNYAVEFSLVAAADVPCAQMDCARSCAAKQAPDQAAWAAGTVWTDCLASCPGVVLNTGLFPSIQANQLSQWMTPTQTAEMPIATPSGACSIDELETPCNANCCALGTYCSLWNRCAGAAGEPTPTGAGFTISGGTGPSATINAGTGPSGTSQPARGNGAMINTRSTLGPVVCLLAVAFLLGTIN